MGHAKESLDIDLGDRVYIGTNAHNYYIQVAYSAGIVAGIALLFMSLLVIKDSFVGFYKLFKSCNKQSYEMYYTCIAVSFVINSLTSGGYMLYSYFVPTLFWIMIHEFAIGKE